jgi:hypothetical protein
MDLAQCVEAAAAAADQLDDRSRPEIQAVIAEFGAPLRVAVVGRTNVGKSTIVNALLKRRAAATDLTSCTRLVTWYSSGERDEANARLRDGRSRVVPLDFVRGLGELPAGLLEDDVSRIDVKLRMPPEVGGLTGVTLIDTPGYDDHDETVKDRVTAVFRQHDVHAVLFVLNGTVSQADHTFITTVHNEARAEGTVLNTVGAQTKFDDTNPDDPWAAGVRLAERNAADLQLTVAIVQPVMGKLAQTASHPIGGSDEFVIRKIAKLRPDLRAQALADARELYVVEIADVSVEARRNLVDRLGMYGVRYAVEHIDRATGDGELQTALVEHSRIAQLIEQLTARFAVRADVLKAAVVAKRLLLRAPAGDPQLSRLREAALNLVHHRDLNILKVVAAYQNNRSGDLALPADLAQDLRNLATGATVGEQLGFEDRQASVAEMCKAAGAAANRWQDFRTDATARQKHAVEDVLNEYALISARLQCEEPT